MALQAFAKLQLVAAPKHDSLKRCPASLRPYTPFVCHSQRDEAIYNKECLSSRCFRAKVVGNDALPVSYSAFRKLNVKWQSRLGQVFRTCLASNEYVQTRNAVLVLKGILEVSMSFLCRCAPFGAFYEQKMPFPPSVRPGA